jgi:hypothetical protein
MVLPNDSSPARNSRHCWGIDLSSAWGMACGPCRPGNSRNWCASARRPRCPVRRNIWHSPCGSGARSVGSFPTSNDIRRFFPYRPLRGWFDDEHAGRQSRLLAVNIRNSEGYRPVSCPRDLWCEARRRISKENVWLYWRSPDRAASRTGQQVYQTAVHRYSGDVAPWK